MTADISLAEASGRWLVSKANLAAATRSSYAGELTRFSEFLASKRVVRAREVSAKLWADYIKQMTQERAGVQTKRRAALNGSSAAQAARITRSFLAWAREEELITWTPKRQTITGSVATQGSATKRSGHIEVPARLRPMLLGSERADGEKECRGLLVVNLVFWGAMKPSELVQMRVQHLKRSTNGMVRAAIPGRNQLASLPAHTWVLWERYRTARIESTGAAPTPRAALIARLRSEEGMTPWSIWALLQSFLATAGLHSGGCTPRLIRKEYLRLSMNDAVAAAAQVLELTGLNSVQWPSSGGTAMTSEALAARAASTMTALRRAAW